MTSGLPHDLASTPQPVQRLAALLAERRISLRAVPIKNPQRGDRLYMADTHVGQVRVWRNQGKWAVEVAPTGFTEWVDAGVWQACADGTELGIARPSLAASVDWVEGLLGSRGTPHYDAACLRDLVAQRASQPMAITGVALWVLLGVAIPVMAFGVWISIAHDLAGVRIGVSVLFASLVTALLLPYAHRARTRRAARKR